MPRASRFAPGGDVDHALEREVARLPLFKKGKSTGLVFELYGLTEVEIKIVEEAMAGA